MADLMKPRPKGGFTFILLCRLNRFGYYNQAVMAQVRISSPAYRERGSLSNKRLRFQRPVNWGLRFSMNAFKPSFLSLVPNV